MTSQLITTRSQLETAKVNFAVDQANLTFLLQQLKLDLRQLQSAQKKLNTSRRRRSSSTNSIHAQARASEIDDLKAFLKTLEGKKARDHYIFTRSLWRSCHSAGRKDHELCDAIRAALDALEPKYSVEQMVVMNSIVDSPDSPFVTSGTPVLQQDKHLVDASDGTNGAAANVQLPEPPVNGVLAFVRYLPSLLFSGILVIFRGVYLLMVYLWPHSVMVILCIACLTIAQFFKTSA